MQIVSSFTLAQPNTISFKTSPPGDDVVGYAAKLFRITHHSADIVRQWTASQLEAGVQFPFDATAGVRYEISLGATVTKEATIDTLTTFSPPPPDDDPETVSLDPNEGLNVRIWFFLPL
jgi:hypothetical protein